MPYPRRRRAPLRRKPRPTFKRAAAKKLAYRRKYATVGRYTTAAGAMTNSLWRYGQRTRLSKQVLAMKRVGAPDEWVVNGSSLVQNATGYQKYASFPILPQPTIKEILQTVGNQSSPNRAVLESAISELTFTNMSNCAAEVEIYDLVLKRDVLDLTTWTIGANTYTAVGDVGEYIRAGVNAGNGVAPGLNYHEIIGSSPFDSQMFNTYFKVNKRTHVMLASGATHRHQSMLKINKVVNQAVAASSNLELVKGITHIVLLLVRGIAGYDGGGETGSATRASLNTLFTQRIKYSYIQDVNQTLTYDDNLLHADPVSVRNIGNGLLEAVSP